MPKRLRVVNPGESGETAVKPPKKLSVVEAATSGSHQDLLVAVQARIADAVQQPNCNPVALAALSRQMILISKELSMIAARVEDEIDEAARIPDEPWSGDAV